MRRISGFSVRPSHGEPDGNERQRDHQRHQRSGDTIAGLAGSDTINANLGNDTVIGGDGADTINGGDGNDVLYGHSSADLAANSGIINTMRVATGLGGATSAVSPPGEPTMLYVTRKDVGDIVRVNPANGAQETFLDLAPDTDFMPDGEQGLLCVAFHPDYDTNGRFFVFLTNPNGDVEIREYKRSTTDPSVADPTMVQSIITIPHPGASNHNGGFVGFGPDGKLYITVGDGGGVNDQFTETRMCCWARSFASMSTATIFPATPRATTPSRLTTRSSAKLAPTRSGIWDCAIRSA